MSVYSNHLSRPLQERAEEKSKALQEASPQVDLQEALTLYLTERQRALYRQLLRDDQPTMASPGSRDNLLEVLGKLKEVEKLKQEMETITKGLRNARPTRKPYS